jgi:hypothetical protein
MRTFALLVALALTVEFAQTENAPVAEPHVRVEGDRNRVSDADIRTVIKLASHEIGGTDPTAHPVDTIRIVDHDHITIFYRTHEGLPITLDSKKIGGRWRLVPIERVITRGTP